MKINWKDFGLMFVIGIILYILLTASKIASGRTEFQVGYTPQLVDILYIILLFGIPFAFYFLRNKSELKEVVVVSFAFGLTFPILLFHLILFIYSLINSFSHDAVIMLYPGITNWPGLVITLITYAIIITIYGLIIWFAVNKLKWEKS